MRYYYPILSQLLCFNGGDDRCIQGFGGETLRKETTWKTQA